MQNRRLQATLTPVEMYRGSSSKLCEIAFGEKLLFVFLLLMSAEADAHDGCHDVQNPPTGFPFPLTHTSWQNAKLLTRHVHGTLGSQPAVCRNRLCLPG